MPLPRTYCVIARGLTWLFLSPCIALILQAGQLYAQAEQYERAAELFLSCREFALLDGVMGHAGSPDLWLRSAQAKEGEWALEAIVSVEGCGGRLRLLPTQDFALSTATAVLHCSCLQIWEVLVMLHVRMSRQETAWRPFGSILSVCATLSQLLSWHSARAASRAASRWLATARGLASTS